MRKLIGSRLALFSGISRDARQRFAALFLFVIFSVSIVAPTASAYAATRPEPDQPVAQDYPGPLESRTEPADLAGSLQKAKPMGERLQQSAPKSPAKTGEIAEKRTAYTTQTRNSDGTVTEKQYFTPIHYQKDGRWETIDTTLVEDKNAGDSHNIAGEAYGQVQSWFSSATHFTTKDNDWQARFSPSDFEKGMVRVRQGDSQIGFVPLNAKSVAPVITADSEGRQTVHYYDSPSPLSKWEPGYTSRHSVGSPCATDRGPRAWLASLHVPQRLPGWLDRLF
jgi:hypothetical protein